MKEETTNQGKGTESGWLSKIRGGAAFVAGVILAIGMISLVVTTLLPGAQAGWLSAFQGMWLIVIFKLHAGFSGVKLDLLTGVNLLDLTLLALVGVMQAGLYTALRRTSKVWSIVAAIQPWLGIVLLLATNTAGRSAVMGATLVASLVMLGSALFNKVGAYLGIVGSLLLLAGDFSAGVIPASPLVATLFGVGYVLLTIWFFLVGGTLYGLGSPVSSSQFA